jgi:hypothetical protein
VVSRGYGYALARPTIPEMRAPGCDAVVSSSYSEALPASLVRFPAAALNAARLRSGGGRLKRRRRAQLPGRGPRGAGAASGLQISRRDAGPGTPLVGEPAFTLAFDSLLRFQRDLTSQIMVDKSLKQERKITVYG